MNIKELGLLNCRKKENRKYIIQKFNDIEYIVKKGYDYSDFKDDLDSLIEFAQFLENKANVRISAISYFEHRQDCLMTVYENALRKEKDFSVMVASLNLNEMYIKICLICYAVIKRKRKNRRK